MSTIEDKVVSLKFDNKQFQSGVAESLQSVEKLNTGLIEVPFSKRTCISFFSRISPDNNFNTLTI